MQLTDDESEEHSPSWSPDGSQIVFSEGGAYDQDVSVMDADGSDVHRLTDWGGFDGVPVWSPDGAWISFTSDRGATTRQQEVNRTGEGVAAFEIYLMRPMVQTSAVPGRARRPPVSDGVDPMNTSRQIVIGRSGDGRSGAVCRPSSPTPPW